MSWKVLSVVGLPVLEERVVHRYSDGTEVKDKMATGEVDRKEPGDSITKKELDEAGQSANDIESLIASGAIEEA